MNYKGFVDI